jgi:two-component system, NarL family, invasion response regulator UvrY
LKAQTRVLVIPRNDALLCASTFAEALAKETGFDVEFGDELARLATGNIRQIDLAIVFVKSTTTGTIREIRRVQQVGCRLLLVLEASMALPLRQLCKVGADGVISEGSSYREALSAIQIITARNLKYLSPLVLQTLESTDAMSLNRLSTKEMEVAFSVSEGKRNSEIAEDLNISPKTVSSYKTRIYEKLGVSNSAQLTRLFFNRHTIIS